MLKETIAREMIEELIQYEGLPLSDVLFEMYGNSYYIIGTYQAKEFIKNNLDEIFTTLGDYFVEFGEFYFSLTDYEGIVNFVVYMIANEIWCDLETLELNLWDGDLTLELIEFIVDELKETYGI